MEQADKLDYDLMAGVVTPQKKTIERTVAPLSTQNLGPVEQALYGPGDGRRCPTRPGR